MNSDIEYEDAIKALKSLKRQVDELESKLETLEKMYTKGDRVYAEVEIMSHHYDGHDSGYYITFKDGNKTNGAHNFFVKESDVYSKLPTLKEEPEWHNPGNLTQEQLGESYRFLTKDEVISRSINKAFVWRNTDIGNGS